ncbi:PAS domain-containing sensor histidine kinase [Pseudomonas cichorii]|uniref:PAS domain-containing sensor histidine kinase n=1 Tax=Pseudomonas cichorii TaxID=36746 RepID=UPI001C89D152|nr:PAS domain-containing sensor histidine kinase [Pseudomonas cichorii]MBX8497229.1 PAS domain-containing sensor histidine kinase [Pseudomonas cichorii]
MSSDAPAVPDGDDLFEGAPCGLLLTRENGTIERVNQTFCGWLGVEREALLGRRFQDLLNMAGKIFHQTHWAPLLHARGSVAEVKLELIHADGRSIPMMLNGIRREHDGVFFNELALFIAEERNKYERELLAAQKLSEELLLQQMSIQTELTSARNRLRLAHVEAEIRAIFAEQMVSIFSHDLRNPLAAIKMASGLLERSALEPRQERMLGHINHATDRAQRMIVDLLDFTDARVGRGISVTPHAIDLHAVTQRSVEELRQSFPGHVITHRREGDGPCHADADRLGQVIGNLVANAINYGSADGEIVVTSALEPHLMRLSVHNFGEPIPPEQIESLFEPAVRSASDTDESRSVGLGLFIVREIVRAHLGDVIVLSSPEHGTTFTASIPQRV